MALGMLSQSRHCSLPIRRCLSAGHFFQTARENREQCSRIFDRRDMDSRVVDFTSRAVPEARALPNPLRKCIHTFVHSSTPHLSASSHSRYIQNWRSLLPHSIPFQISRLLPTTPNKDTRSAVPPDHVDNNRTNRSSPLRPSSRIPPPRRTPCESCRNKKQHLTSQKQQRANASLRRRRRSGLQGGHV